jgi:hypothetical protein
LSLQHLRTTKTNVLLVRRSASDRHREMRCALLGVGKDSYNFSLRPAAAVAHVRSEDSGGWWRYDDSEVTRMAKGPAGEHADHGIAADKKASMGSIVVQNLLMHPICNLIGVY